MATNFPASLDSLTNPTSSDSLNLPSHSAQHANVNDAVEALQAKVGADSSGVASSHDYKIAQLEAISHGKILQVVSTTKTDGFTTTSTSMVDVTGLSVVITPSSATSKVLIVAMVSMSANTAANEGFGQIVRDSTPIALADASGSRTRATFGSDVAGDVAHNSVSVLFLDSPATTSATTYKIQVQSNTSGTVAVNRGYNDSNVSTRGRTVSTITVLEVGA